MNRPGGPRLRGARGFGAHNIRPKRFIKYDAVEC